MPKAKTKTIRSRVTGAATTFRLCPPGHLKKIRDYIKELEKNYKAFMKAANSKGKIPFPNPVEEWEKQFSRMDALDQEAKDLGYKVLGRLCSWPVADGKAHYFVESENGRICRMIWVPISDRYQSPAVCDGLAFKEAVEQNIRSHEGLKAIFSKP